jgi:hypothetical protein
VSAEPHAKEAVVTVRDTGRDIDPEKILSLFQKFVPKVSPLREF